MCVQIRYKTSTGYHPIVLTPRKPTNSISTGIVNADITIFEWYSNMGVTLRYTQFIDRRLKVNICERGAHIFQIPHFDCTIITTRNNFICTNKRSRVDTSRTKRNIIKSKIDSIDLTRNVLEIHTRNGLLLEKPTSEMSCREKM